MSTGIATGWHHACWALGYLLGALPVLLALVLAVAVVIGARSAIGSLIEHRLRVRRLHRQARAFGRTPGANTPTGY